MLVLTEGWYCAGRPGIVAGVGVRRRGVGRRSRRGRYGVLGTPGLDISMRGVPANMPRGSGGSGIAGGEEIAAVQEPSPSGGPAQFRIFDVFSSTGLEIEGYLTCWKDELGNHTLGMKGQNMHQLRVFGVK